jgi:hypothetical protein
VVSQEWIAKKRSPRSCAMCSNGSRAKGKMHNTLGIGRQAGVPVRKWSSEDPAPTVRPVGTGWPRHPLNSACQARETASTCGDEDHTRHT